MKFKTVLTIFVVLLAVAGFWYVHTYYLGQSIELSFGAGSDLITVQSTLTFVLIMVVILAVVLIILWKIISLIIFFPQHFKNWRRKRYEKKRLASISQGLHAMVLGQADSQYKSFKSAADAGVAPAVTYYLAAAVTKDEKSQQNLLRKAAAAEGDPMVQAMATAQMRLKANLPAEASEVLRIAGAATHKANQPLKLLLEACEKSGDIRGAIDVAQTLLERDSTPGLRRKIGVLTTELLKEAGSSEDIKGLIGAVSKSGNSPTSIAIAAAKKLAAVKDEAGASLILNQAWKQSKNDTEILDAIAKYGSAELVKQILGRSDELLHQQTNNIELMCALADLAMREKLWGQARKLLNDALHVKEERSVYLRLAKLADAEGKSSEESNRLYRLAAQVAE